MGRETRSSRPPLPRVRPTVLALAAVAAVMGCGTAKPPPSTPIHTSPPLPPDEERAAEDAAATWLAMVDRDDEPTLWREAAPALRRKLDERRFVALLREARQSMGAFRSRTFRMVKFGSDAPDGPPGKYAAVTFDSHYDAFTDAEDHVLLRLEEDNRWRVVGFFTNPASCRAPDALPASALPAPPPALGLDPFYAKYVDDGGLPLVGSARVSDRALLAARTLIDHMLRKRPDLRARLVAETAHVSIMAASEQTLDIPENRHLAGTSTDTPGVDWNERARGLGGLLEDPVASAGEENLLCMPCDRYRGSSVLVHEFAHLLERVALAHDHAFRRALDEAFANAKDQKLFQAEYPSRDKHEYWAVGAQSWFETNVPSERRTRAELRATDPKLAALLAQVFPDDDWRPTCSAVEDPPVLAETPRPPIARPHECPAGMASLPGGDFVYGDAEVVQPFCMDTTEVTVEAYAACVRAGKCTPAATEMHVSGVSAEQNARWGQACNGARADRRKHPANCVTWGQATAYCKAQGKRLPTEQEWEWAARGGPKATPFPWGNAPPKDQLCWSGDGKREATCEVGHFPAGDSPHGIHDLAGNVWEWTSDRDENGSPVVKGSAFNADDEAAVRVTGLIDGGDPDFAAHIGGFRCVR